jgi:cytochrome c oxidase cbb3-type subunit 2
MAKGIYSRPILFALTAVGVILVGTIVTMFVPMLTISMHPKLESLKPYTALQLAGRDIYQREGCVNCHTQEIRPLKTEVMRYGEYSKAGEFAYDRPFLWGSKRTGPDLAREGGKYPDAWHVQHFANPRALVPVSVMPVYGWLAKEKLDPKRIEAHMKVNGFPYTADELAQLAAKTGQDALIAYVQQLGTAVPRAVPAPVTVATGAERAGIVNPLAGNAPAIKRGSALFGENCAVCHGDDGKGAIGPSLVDDMFFSIKGDLPDVDYQEVINNGIHPGQLEEGRVAKDNMPAFGTSLSSDEIWSIVAYVRSLQGKK